MTMLVLGTVTFTPAARAQTTDDPAALDEPTIVIDFEWGDAESDLIFSYVATTNPNPTENPRGGSGHSAGTSAGCDPDAVVHGEIVPIVLTVDADFELGYLATARHPGEYSIVVWGGTWCAYYGEPSEVDLEDANAREARYPAGTEIAVTAHVTYYNIAGTEPQTFTAIVPVTPDVFDPAGRRVLGTVVLPEVAEPTPASPGGSDADLGGAPIPGVSGEVDPGPNDPDASSESAEGAEEAPTESAEETASASDDGSGGSSNSMPLAVGLAIAIIVLVMLLGIVAAKWIPKMIQNFTHGVLTDPEGTAARARTAMLNEVGDDFPYTTEADAKAAAAGPSFEATTPVSGATATTAAPLQAVSGDGTTVEVPGGQTHPAGMTTQWHGTDWTSIKVGDEWVWAPTESLSVTDIGASIPQGTPQQLSLLPYTSFELTEPLVHETRAPSGLITRHQLDPGHYRLGAVQTTPSGNVYEVLEQDNFGVWKTHSWVAESLLAPTN